MNHDELLAKMFETQGGAIYQALRAVVELHNPWELENGVGVRCSFCAGYDYPCPTIQAIEKELK